MVAYGIVEYVFHSTIQHINPIDDIRILYKKVTLAIVEDTEKIENLDFTLESDDIFL